MSNKKAAALKFGFLESLQIMGKCNRESCILHTQNLPDVNSEQNELTDNFRKV
jgi:hypothetical protein